MAKKASRKRNYVTKRVFKVAVGAAVRKASREAMNSMGYVVKVEDGWVVREDSDGNKMKIAKINKTRGAIALD